MGRTTTPTYVVHMRVPGYAFTPAAWHVRSGVNRVGYGKPTVENLRRYIEEFEASTREGGCNAHLDPTTVRSARIEHQTTGETVASYEGT